MYPKGVNYDLWGKCKDEHVKARERRQTTKTIDKSKHTFKPVRKEKSILLTR